MKSSIRIALFVALISCVASKDNAAKPTTLNHDAAMYEIVIRSRLTPDVVRDILSDCAANQQSITFCAWRDQIEAEATLSNKVSVAVARFPFCGDSLNRSISLWRKRRDSLCKVDAAKEYGGGSNESAAFSQCAASMTNAYARQIYSSRPCKS